MACRLFGAKPLWYLRIPSLGLNEFTRNTNHPSWALVSTNKRWRVENFLLSFHDDVIKWKHFPRNWPFVRGIHRSPVNSTHKGQWRGALMFSLIRARIKCWVDTGEAGDLRRYRVHCDVIVMSLTNGKVISDDSPLPKEHSKSGYLRIICCEKQYSTHSDVKTLSKSFTLIC